MGGVREGFDYYARTTNGAGGDASPIYLRFQGDSWILSLQDTGSDSIAEMKVDEIPEDKTKNFCPNIRYTWKSCGANDADRKRRSEDDSVERTDITVQHECHSSYMADSNNKFSNGAYQYAGRIHGRAYFKLAADSSSADSFLYWNAAR